MSIDTASLDDRAAAAVHEGAARAGSIRSWCRRLLPPARFGQLGTVPAGHRATELDAHRRRSSGAKSNARPARRLIAEGESDGPLLTLLAGWAFRFKSRARRATADPELSCCPATSSACSKSSPTPPRTAWSRSHRVRLCSFQRNAVWTLHRELPSLGYDITWLAAHEEALVDNNLLSVGRHNALRAHCHACCWCCMRGPACTRLAHPDQGVLVPRHAAAPGRCPRPVAGAHQQDHAPAGARGSLRLAARPATAAARPGGTGAGRPRRPPGDAGHATADLTSPR